MRRLTAFILLFFMLSCSASAEQRMAPAFKGIEIYSYLDAKNNFKYAFLLGTNRKKTAQEIFEAGADLDALIKKLEECPAGEWVFWISSGSSVLVDNNTDVIHFALPDSTTVEKIKTICKSRKINLMM